jgi:tetratricopeptide (TPR) repeat protein
MLIKRYYILSNIFVLLIAIIISSCNYISHRTISKNGIDGEEDPEPIYDISLNSDYQDFVSYVYMGNRSENFSAYFNKYYSASTDYENAIKNYKSLILANYNRRLDSVYTLPTLPQIIKDTLNGVIARTSKILQYHKNSRFLDVSVLLIGKSYYFIQDYFAAERKFGEFISKFGKSKYKDEVLLYMGRTKLRMKKYDDGIFILNTLVDNSIESDIKTDAAQELGLFEIHKGNYQNAIKYLEKSISTSNNKDVKSENLFLLARLYSLYDLKKASEIFTEVIKYSSDFDLTFYGKLNYAKTTRLLGNLTEANKLFENLVSRYRDYPEFKQLAELEIANVYYAQKNFKSAFEKYYDVIIDYPRTKSSSEAYYYLAKHYEVSEKNYFKALINYARVNEEFSNNDFSDYSSNRTTTLNRYFDLLAIVNDTTKGEIPKETTEFEKYKAKKEKEKGEIKDRGKENFENFPKSGGLMYFSEKIIPNDSIDGKSLNDSLDMLIKSQGKDTTEGINKSNDSLIRNNLTNDSTKNIELITKENLKFNAFLELAQLFTYQLNNLDSAEYYIKTSLLYTTDNNNQTKANFFLATIKKIKNSDVEANTIFQEIINVNPNSVYANEARKMLGIPIIILENDAENSYKSAEVFIASNQTQKAIIELKNIIYNYNDSRIKAKSTYTLGWIYENLLFNKDSMLYYYNIIKNDYPSTEYYSNISSKLDYFKTLEINKISDSTVIIPKDSLNKQENIPIDSTKIRTEQDSTKIKTEQDSTIISKPGEE